MLPYGDAWRARRRIFTKYFNPSNPSVNEPRDIIYVRRFLGQLLQTPNDFLQHVRTCVSLFAISQVNTLHPSFLHISLVGSTTLSITYSINVQPYDDPYIKIAEEAIGAASELLIAGAFLVDIIPVLKFVPAWFPGASFQRKAVMLRKHAANLRNFPFAATEKLMVCDSSFFFSSGFLSNCVLRPMVTMIARSSQRGWVKFNIPTPLTKISICWKIWPPRRMWVSSRYILYLPFQLMKRYLRGSGHHGFSTWNILLGDGLLSRCAEEGSSRTWQSPQWKASRT